MPSSTPNGNDKTKVLMAFRADWVAKNKNSLTKTWIDGGTLRLTRLTEPKETGKYDLKARRATRSTGRWCRWPSRWS